mmetsp:Transcript_60099/g.161063  ORF Transcript_60099/g.161063 Transcript_60099/m.161063 type:complete len:135 (-) Transcript_60099:645-1049(-)
MRSMSGIPMSKEPEAPPEVPDAVGLFDEHLRLGLAEQDTFLAAPVEEDVFLGARQLVGVCARLGSSCTRPAALERLGGMKENRLPAYVCNCESSMSLLSQWPLTRNPASMMVSNRRRLLARAWPFLLPLMALMA